MSLNFGHSALAQYQTRDSLNKNYIYNSTSNSKLESPSYSYLQLRTGMFSGFQIIQKDSVNITVGIPIELRFRYFPKNSFNLYFGAEIGYNFFALNNNILITAFSTKLNYGMISKKYSYSTQGNIGYLHGNGLDKHPQLLRYRHMLSFGYSFESSAISLNLEIISPLKELALFQSGAIIFTTLEFQFKILTSQKKKIILTN